MKRVAGKLKFKLKLKILKSEKSIFSRGFQAHFPQEKNVKPPTLDSGQVPVYATDIVPMNICLYV